MKVAARKFAHRLNTRPRRRDQMKREARQLHEAGALQAEQDLGDMSIHLGILGVLSRSASEPEWAATRARLHCQDRPLAYLRGYLAGQESWLESARDAEAESIRIFGADVAPIAEEG